VRKIKILLSFNAWITFYVLKVFTKFSFLRKKREFSSLRAANEPPDANRIEFEWMISLEINFFLSLINLSHYPI